MPSLLIASRQAGRDAWTEVVTFVNHEVCGMVWLQHMLNVDRVPKGDQIGQTVHALVIFIRYLETITTAAEDCQPDQDYLRVSQPIHRSGLTRDTGYPCQVLLKNFTPPGIRFFITSIESKVLSNYRRFAGGTWFGSAPRPTWFQRELEGAKEDGKKACAEAEKNAHPAEMYYKKGLLGVNLIAKKLAIFKVTFYKYLRHRGIEIYS